MENIEMKPFCSTDWMGFAGAERFEDGAEPMIGYILVDDFDAIVILDANGLHISWDIPVEADEDAEGAPVLHEETETLGFSFSGSFALRALAGLKASMTMIELKTSAGAVAS